MTIFTTRYRKSDRWDDNLLVVLSSSTLLKQDGYTYLINNYFSKSREVELFVHNDSFPSSQPLQTIGNLITKSSVCVQSITGHTMLNFLVTTDLAVTCKLVRAPCLSSKINNWSGMLYSELTYLMFKVFSRGLTHLHFYIEK